MHEQRDDDEAQHEAVLVGELREHARPELMKGERTQHRHVDLDLELLPSSKAHRRLRSQHLTNTVSPHLFCCLNTWCLNTWCLNGGGAFFDCSSLTEVGPHGSEGQGLVSECLCE